MACTTCGREVIYDNFQVGDVLTYRDNNTNKLNTLTLSQTWARNWGQRKEMLRILRSAGCEFIVVERDT